MYLINNYFQEKKSTEKTSESLTERNAVSLLEVFPYYPLITANQNNYSLCDSLTRVGIEPPVLTI